MVCVLGKRSRWSFKSNVPPVPPPPISGVVECPLGKEKGNSLQKECDFTPMDPDVGTREETPIQESVMSETYDTKGLHLF